jgi:hypothetical protein
MREVRLGEEFKDEPWHHARKHEYAWLVACRWDSRLQARLPYA